MATKTETKKEIAEVKKPSFSVTLTEALEENKQALPKDFNTLRFVQNAVAVLNENETVQKFAKQYGTAQIKQCMLKGAFLGLDFVTSEAYLVPFEDKLTFMTSYKGAEKLVKKYSQRPVKSIYAKVVRQGDEFEEVIVNGEQTINFKPLPFNGNAIIGAFAVCQFEDGGMQYDTMSLEELENTRKHSKAKNSPAWANYTAEMYKKTVLHRLCKHITIDFDNPSQVEAFNEGTEIETDVKEQTKNDLEQTATEEFTIDSTAREIE